METWELPIIPVETNHCYGFRFISVSRLTPIFHLFPIFWRKFLGGWQCTFQASPKGEYFKNSQQNQPGCFYDMWVWRETSYSYLFRLQLLCPHNSRKADARKFELSLFYRPRWWRRKQFTSEENKFNISRVGSNWSRRPNFALKYSSAAPLKCQSEGRAHLGIFCTYSWRNLFFLER